MTAEDVTPSALHAARLDVGYPEIHGDNEQRDETHIDVRHEHQYQGENGTRKQRQYFDEEIVHRVRQRHDTPVDTRLELARLVTLAGKECQAERQDAVDHLQRQVAADEDAQLFAVVALEERNHQGHKLLAQQYDGDDGQYLHRVAPQETVLRLYQRIDGIHGLVQHHGIHLCHQRPDERQHQCQRDEPPVGQHKGQDILQQRPNGHPPRLFGLLFCVSVHLGTKVRKWNERTKKNGFFFCNLLTYSYLCTRFKKNYQGVLTGVG